MLNAKIHRLYELREFVISSSSNYTNLCKLSHERELGTESQATKTHSLPKSLVYGKIRKWGKRQYDY